MALDKDYQHHYDRIGKETEKEGKKSNPFAESWRKKNEKIHKARSKALKGKIGQSHV